MTSAMKRSFILTLTTLAIPYGANAMELGDIKLNSYLYQSLQAQISVQPSEGNEMRDARISLAPRTDFEKAGITRSAALDHIKFRLEKDKDGKPIIQLTTQGPVKEPILDFIVEMTWPKGHLTREYTVLLDTPANSQQAAPPSEARVAIPSSENAATGSAAQLQEASSAASSSAVANRSIEPKLTPDGYGPTMRPNTLWDIAKALRPDESVSIEQVMLALVKKNPEAFYHNNVNELKAGYFLHTPDKALIMRVSEADAGREVKLQYQRWLQSRKGKLPSAAVATSNPSDAEAKPLRKTMAADAT